MWLLVALSALGLQFSLAARDRRLSAINSVDASRALAAADAGIEHARARLEHRLRQPARSSSRFSASGLASPLDPWHSIERTFTDTASLPGARYAVTLRDAGATLNVNTATEDELRRLFVALRLDAGRADRLAQRIADWRDVDDMRRARGAEREQYLRAGSPFLPENRPFRDVAEVGSVLDVTARELAVIAPYLSVRGSGRVNLRSADRAVLLALPGMGEEAAAVIMRLRRSPSAFTIDEVQQQLSSAARAALLERLPVLTSRTVSETREVEVLSDGWAEGGNVRVRVGALIVRADPATIVVGRRVE